MACGNNQSPQYVHPNRTKQELPLQTDQFAGRADTAHVSTLLKVPRNAAIIFPKQKWAEFTTSSAALLMNTSSTNGLN